MVSKLRKVMYYLAIFVVCFMLDKETLVANAANILPDQLADIVYRQIPVEAQRHVESIYEDIWYHVRLNHSIFEKELHEVTNLKLGMPLVILEDKKEQSEIYYYPIINRTVNKVELMLSVMGTDTGWNVAIDTEYVDLLNLINYPEEYYILYKIGNTYIAEGLHKSLTIVRDKEQFTFNKRNGELNILAKSFDIPKRMEKMKKTSIGEARRASKCIGVEKYAPSFGVSTSTSQIMALYNAKGQTSALCWASSVATIVNYLYGTNYSPEDVADSQGIGYDCGGNIYDKQRALGYYSVNYSYATLSQLSLNSVKTNVGNMRPIAMSLCTPADSSGNSDWHATTLYGYGGSYIHVWNSGLNSGAGGSQMVEYSSSGTSLPYGGQTFIWTYSLSAAQ